MDNNYHVIDSIITFLPDLYDNIFIKKSNRLVISTFGEFSGTLCKMGGDTIVEKTIYFLQKKYNISSNFEIKIKKNIPLGAGFGGGSADAAAVARLILKTHNLNIKKKEIIDNLSNIGADIPVCYYSFNQRVEGFGEKITKLKTFNKTMWALLIKPNSPLSTKEIFKKFTKPFSFQPNYKYNYKNLIFDIKHSKNDLQKIAESSSFQFKYVLKSLPKTKEAVTIPKMTGSGSAIFILFNSKISAKKYSRSIHKITKNCWKKISKVIL